MYNYKHFPEDMEAETFAAFRDHISVGARAPDGELVEWSSGERVRLSTLWKKNVLLIEFGSYS